MLISCGWNDDNGFGFGSPNNATHNHDHHFDIDTSSGFWNHGYGNHVPIQIMIDSNGYYLIPIDTTRFISPIVLTILIERTSDGDTLGGEHISVLVDGNLTYFEDEQFGYVKDSTILIDATDPNIILDSLVWKARMDVAVQIFPAISAGGYYADNFRLKPTRHMLYDTLKLDRLEWVGGGPNPYRGLFTTRPPGYIFTLP